MVRVHTALANVRTAVDGAMVSTLAAAIENQVVVHVITAAHAIVEVEACTSQIKAKILGQRGLCGFGLEPARALLLPELVGSVRHEQKDALAARVGCSTSQCTRCQSPASHCPQEECSAGSHRRSRPIRGCRCR